jgi:hypothetical protein
MARSRCVVGVDLVDEVDLVDGVDAFEDDDEDEDDLAVGVDIVVDDG